MRRPPVRILLLAQLLLAVTGTQAAGTSAPVPDPAAEVGLPFLEVFEPREYGGHTQVWNAVADAAGVMHFGNFGRVLSYDGARWSHFEVPGTTFVRALAVDERDVLWVGAVNELGYAASDATGARMFVSLKDKLPVEARACGELWRVLLTPRGPLFQSNTWLLRWDGEAFATLPLPGPGGWQAVSLGTAIWLSHPKHGWSALTDDGSALQQTTLARPEAFSGATLICSVPGAKPGEFILATGRAGLVRWDGSTFTSFVTNRDEALKAKRPYRACPLPGGRFALSTLQGGAFIFDLEGKLLAQLDDTTGLPDNTVINLGSDANGGLWLCLERGVVRVDARSWLTWFGPLSGAPRSQLATLRFAGSLFVASSGGLLRLAPASDSSPARLQPVSEVKEYLSTLVDAGRSLIGVSEQGLVEWAEGTVSRLPGELIDAQSFGASGTQPGRWFALASEQIHTLRRDESAWTYEGRIPGIENVRSIFEGTDGAWWLGLSDEGVLRVTFAQASATGPGAPVIERFGTAQGLPVGHGWTRVMLAGGRLLLSCEKGLFRFDAGSQRFAPTDEFGVRFRDGTFTTRTLVADPKGGMWIAARAAGQAELVTPIDLGLADGAGWHPLRLPQLARLDDVTDLRVDGNVLWVSGHSGIMRVDLSAWRAAPAESAPRLTLREVTAADGVRLPLAGGWELPFGRRSLRLRFAAPSFGRDPQTSYETTLLSSAGPLVLSDPTPERSFAALSPGDYRVRVRGRGADGRWSEPVELAFAILAPWWSSTGALLGYGGLAGLAIAAGVRQRTRALERRAERLEAVVAQRTEELRASNVELARLHQLELDEKIAARLGEEKARLEVLRYQLNPHFLFNALTSVRAQLPAALKGARETLGQLTEFCRSTLLRPAGDVSPTLAQELGMLASYLAIEQTRWGDLMEVQTDFDPAAGELLIPPLLLLPLVENALKYGRATSPDQLRLCLSSRRADDTLILEIANSGTWVEPESRGDVPSLGIGMENLRQRLKRFYPDRHDVQTSSADGFVTIRLRLTGEPRV